MYKVQILKLYKQGKSYNEISNILGCVKSTVSYHCKKEGINTGIENKLSEEDISEMKKMYKNHFRKEVAKKFNISETTVTYHCGTKRVKSNTVDRKRKNIERVTERRRKNKEALILYKGSRCERCGYNKCNGALEFHHLDPKEKDFSISSKGMTKSLENLKKEVDKCIMVCANCHREIHESV